MRSFASRVAGALVVTVIAASAALSSPAVAALPPVDPLAALTLTADHEDRAVLVPGAPGRPDRSVGYWGKLSGDMPGSYTATCVWLADTHWNASSNKQDNRMFCTILLSFRLQHRGPTDPNGGGLVLQGLVKRPPAGHNLFENPSNRQLAIAGGSGPYKQARGFANLKGAPTIMVYPR
jgi:hypothetical protein